MIIGIIPARYSSSRLKGKPLADIGGKPMIQHTWESVNKSKLISEVIIATDDKRIFETAKSFGAFVVMTPKEIQTGSDRIAYVAKKTPSAEIIVNIQGDEPFIPGKMIDEAIEPLLFDKSVNVSTLAKRITTPEELFSRSIPKVVFDYSSYALYFSRLPIPCVRDADSDEQRLRLGEYYKHVGLYVYRKEALFKFTSFLPTDLEKFEKLEQLRMLENGMKIKVVVTEFDSISVDTQEDLDAARNYYKEIMK
ncbi:MAG: 3-deoxy-manno-octulosonate cytidylyltransferase [Ignavibacteriae bacterium]|nr:MAG: 3-deoxy-manno-octulosonate cytidylyltransferase [Ignavibacteriota bacterium]